MSLPVSRDRVLRRALVAWLEQKTRAIDPTLPTSFTWAWYSDIHATGDPPKGAVYLENFQPQTNASIDAQTIIRRVKLQFTVSNANAATCLDLIEDWAGAIATSRTSILATLRKEGITTEISGYALHGGFKGLRITRGGTNLRINQDEGARGVLSVDCEFPDLVVF